MTVHVRLPHALAVDAGGQTTLQVEAPPDADLSQVLDELSARHPALGRRIRDETGQVRRFVNVYVDDDECRALNGLATVVPAGTTIFVVGSVAGG